MEYNFLKYMFLLLTWSIVFVGALVNWLEELLPVVIRQSFRYGKFSYIGKPSKLKVYEVPKSWFKHFYVFASLYSFYGLYLVIDVYMYGAKPSKTLTITLDFLAGSIGMNHVLVAMSLITLQSFRRFYETWFVSVFSNGKINLSHYVIGYLHYWGTVTAVLAEASGFHTAGGEVQAAGLSVLDWCCIGVFVFAWVNQYKAAVMLASLRKNTTGAVVTTEHMVAHGGLFHYVSSPHLTCEVLVYASLALLLRQNYTFLFVFLWVLSNQTETALLNHWWYKKTFKNYPKGRKALIPYLL